MAAVRAGVGREVAHEAIKENAVAVALAMREQGAGAQRAARPARRRRAPPPDRAELDALMADQLSFTGAARDQVAAVVRAVDAVLASDPEAAQYQAEPIL